MRIGEAVKPSMPKHVLIYLNPTFLFSHKTTQTPASPTPPAFFSRNTSRCLLNSFIGSAAHSTIQSLLYFQLELFIYSDHNLFSVTLVYILSNTIRINNMVHINVAESRIQLCKFEHNFGLILFVQLKEFRRLKYHFAVHQQKKRKKRKEKQSQNLGLHPTLLDFPKLDTVQLKLLFLWRIKSDAYLRTQKSQSE